MTIPVRKLTKGVAYPADGYDETVEFKILHCGNVDGNANKYYVIELQQNSAGRYRIYTEYGRIGNSPARDLREDLYEDDARKEYERIIKSKLRKKTKARNLSDGKAKHSEQYREVDVAIPTVGSPNICKGTGGTATVKKKGSHMSFSGLGYQPSVETLLMQFHRENVHNIEASSAVTVTSNGLETPLGPVTPGHIVTARDCLNRLQAMPGDANHRRDPHNRDVRDLNSEFFSLVPQHMSSKITEADFLLTDDDLDAKFDLLQGMEAALTVVDADDSGKKPDIGLGMIELDTSSDVHKALRDQVHNTMKHGDVRNWRVRRTFELESAKMNQRYRNPVSGGPEWDLFHGSANSNLLSIMLNGFYVPPSSASHVTGRMFGNGVYAASMSSKAFRYSVGLWGGRRSGMPTAYLFVVRFAMGKIFETHSSRFSGAPSGYHSTWAKAGQSLLNDEYIVYDVRQAKATHLIELSQ